MVTFLNYGWLSSIEKLILIVQYLTQRAHTMMT